MLALWAASASPWRIGAALCEMNPERPWVDIWRTVTSVSLPPDIVIWTWTWPNGSWTTAPVNVPLPFDTTLVGWGVEAGGREVPPATGAGVAATGPGLLAPGSADRAGAT